MSGENGFLKGLRIFSQSPPFFFPYEPARPLITSSSLPPVWKHSSGSRIMAALLILDWLHKYPVLQVLAPQVQSPAGASTSKAWTSTAKSLAVFETYSYKIKTQSLAEDSGAQIWRPCYDKSVSSTSNSSRVRFSRAWQQHRSPSLNIGLWSRPPCRGTPAWDAAVFTWYRCPSTHGASEYTGVNMTAKKGLSFFFFFFSPQKLSSVSLSDCGSCHLFLRSLPVVSCWLSHQRLGGYEALWTRRCPAMRERCHPRRRCARTRGRRTRAASPRWEEGGHVRGCCRWRFSPVWELRGWTHLEEKGKGKKAQWEREREVRKEK